MQTLKLLVLGAALLVAPAAFANTSFQIEAKGGAFSPATIELPAGQKVALLVKNSDSSQIEFESYKLNIEQKIDAGGSDTFYVGPLSAGTYDFFDDNNADAKGTVVVR